MLEKSTIKSIFYVRRLIKIYREKKRNWSIDFINLGKTYSRILRKKLWKILKKKEVPIVYLKII